MAYLLFVPMGLYGMLAVAVMLRQPRSVSNAALAVYAWSAVLVTALFVVVGTTSDRDLAGAAALGIFVSASFNACLFFPIALVGLYFETWLQAHWPRLLALGLLIVAGLNVPFLWQAFPIRTDLVQPVENAYYVHFVFDAEPVRAFVAALALICLGLVGVVLAAAMQYRRLIRWREVIPFAGASLVGMAVAGAALSVGAGWSVVATALGLVPPLGLLAFVIFRLGREIPLDFLTQAVSGENVIVLDVGHRVVWFSPQIARWLGEKRPNPFAPPHLFDLVRGTAFARPIERLLSTDETEGEVDLLLDGEEYVLHIVREPLVNVRHLSGGQLLVLRDITASRIRRSLEERSRELLAMTAISTEIASSLEIDQVVERALEQVIALTGAGQSMVYLVNEADKTHLDLMGSRGDVPSFGAPAGVLAVGDTLVEQIMHSRQVVLSANGPTDTSTALDGRDGALNTGAAVPLIARDRVIGLLRVVFPTPRKFDAVEIAMLDSVGRQLAVALDNARLHARERQQRQIAEAMREVASILNSQNLGEALEAMLKQLATLLNYDRATVLLMAEPGLLAIRAHAGFTRAPQDGSLEDVRIPIESFPYLRRLFDERKPQLVANTAVDSVWKPGSFSYYSWMGVPLVTRDQVLGCISLAHNQPGYFTEAHLKLAATFADQAVIAVQNARLFEAEQRRRVQAEVLQQASIDLTSSPDLDSALSASLRHLAELMTFDRAHIGLINVDDRTWTPRVGYPDMSDVPSSELIPIAHFPLIDRMIRTRRPMLVRRTRDHELWRAKLRAPVEAETDDPASWIGAPLIVRDRAIGLLNVDSYTPGSFTEDDFQIAQVFANHIASAVENFRLLEEASRQNRALRALNNVLAASNEALVHDNLLSASLGRVLETLDLEGGMIHQHDTASQELRLRAAAGLPDEVTRRLDRLPPGATLPPVTLADGQRHEFFSVPLVARGSEIGLLSISTCGKEPLEKDLQQVLANIGQQLGVVLENANLFEDTARRGMLSTDLGRLSLAISAQLDRDNVLDLICHESTGIFGVQGVYVWLIDDDKLVGAKGRGAGADRFAGHTIDLSRSDLLPVQVINEWRPRYVNQVAAASVLPADFLAFSEAQSVIAIPLLKADIPIGTLLMVDTTNPYAFADWMLEQVGLLGVQAALAIQNASLFDEIRRRLDQLRLVNEVSRYATAILSLQSLVEGVAKKLYSTLHYDIISLLQIDAGRVSVHSVYVRGQPVQLADIPDGFAMMRSVADKSVQQAEPILENRHCEIGKRILGLASSFDCCSLAVPLIIADEVIGVLIVEREGHHSITKDDLDVLEPLGAQLAISVWNAGLFEKIRQQAIELEARVIERTHEIRQQKERTEAILGSVADAVIMFDLAGQVVMTNPVAKDLFDQHDLNFDLAGRVGALVSQTLHTEEDTPYSTEIIELGAVTLQAKAARVVEGDEVLGSVVVMRDISVLKELDRMKDQFVSNVSHELRTPLANLKLYLSLLQQGRPERRASYMEVMEREVNRLERLISDLLHLSRLQSEHRAERPQVRRLVDMDELIATVIHNNAAWADSEKKTLVHERLAPSLPEVNGDPDQLVRALTNLIANAINYTPAGGTITVRSLVEAARQGESESVIIEVIDTGIGIRDDELPMIFDRFYRGSNVEPNIPGTGLGLAIIKEIVELHGGTIVVESQEGHGSAFRVALPAMRPRH